MPQPAILPLGYAATVNESDHLNISRRSRCAASPTASGAAAQSTLRIRNTAWYAGTVRRNGVPATRTTGGGIANSTGPPSSGTASSSKFGTKNGIFAILPTTTQLLT